FPPAPLTDGLIHKIISGFCAALTDANIREGACAVCACLYPVKDLLTRDECEIEMSLLESDDTFITRQERRSLQDDLLPHTGPVLIESEFICKVCCGSLKKRKMPISALANGNWLGDIPEPLQGLSWAEKMLVSRVCHNRSVVRVVSSGMHKMSANAVFFSTPTPKVYASLPPPREDLDEVIGFVYIGPTKPTDKDLRRTPLLVRRNKVAVALEWLKCNHYDYQDLDISYANLAQYEEEGVPIVTEYKLSADRE
ncbi:hypothetical protein FA95DRAFT_1451682, partial [Auriscalpium vulgare]